MRRSALISRAISASVRPVATSSSLVRHVDPVDVRKAHRRARGREIHLARAGLARHLHDFARRRAADDRIVDEQHDLVLELHADRVQLLAHALLAQRLARHDERAPDVAVLDEALAIREPERVRELQRGRPARVGDRDHDVDVPRLGNAADLVRELLAHVEARLVHRRAVDHRVGPREIDVLEDARREHRVVGAQARVELPGLVDEDGLARRDVAQHRKAQRLQRDRLARDDDTRCRPSPR